MPRSTYIFAVLTVLVLFSCSNSEPGASTPQDAVSQIEEVNLVFATPEVYTSQQLDSLEIEEYLQENEGDVVDADAIRSFYDRRDGQYAWFVEGYLSASAHSFLALINSEDTIHNEVARLRDAVSSSLRQPEGPSESKDLELRLTAKFFEYASKKYEGLVDQDKVKDLDWYIPKRKKDLDQLLDSLAAGKMDLSAVEPMHPQYFLLKEELKDLHAISQLPWEPIRLEEKEKLEPGDRSEVVPEIRDRLKLFGDLVLLQDTLADPTTYDSTMAGAIEAFQERHGLMVDGVIGNNVLKAMNITPAERLRTILVNMERLRWMPSQEAPDLLMVNIPEFKLHVYEENDLRMSMEVVVGTAANRTVIFSDTLSYIVFSPTWTIPRSIIQKEILPKMKADKKYLEKQNMEIFGGTEEEPLIRQTPGGHNSLGRVKFMFPNSFSIYLHDTPAKSLFQRDQRAFSHGCIRVSEPAALAEYLLRNDPEWTTEKIEEAMYSGEENTVPLKEKRPVMITYFTAWVDVQGRLQFRDDIYGHDERLAREIFSSEDPEEQRKELVNN